MFATNRQIENTLTREKTTKLEVKLNYALTWISKKPFMYTCDFFLKFCFDFFFCPVRIKLSACILLVVVFWSFRISSLLAQFINKLSAITFWPEKSKMKFESIDQLIGTNPNDVVELFVNWVGIKQNTNKLENLYLFLLLQLKLHS